MVDYQPDVPPVYENNKPVKVQFGISLQQIQNVVCVHSEICKYWDFFFFAPYYIDKDLYTYSGESVKLLLN